MSTRKQKTDTPGLAELEGAANPLETPGPLPPPGVPARIRTTIDYDRPIDPTPPSGYGDDLRQLAAEELDEETLPEPDFSDPCQEFLYTWQRFAGYSLKVIRLPDPAIHLLPGQSFTRQCREITALGSTTFEPLNFEQSLQALAGGSGGVFRVLLLDTNGQPIPGARLDRIVIADPPRREEVRREDSRYPYGYPPPPQQPPTPPQKSDSELFMEQVQRELFQKALQRALDPPAPPAVDPMASLSQRDRLAVSLLQEGDLLPSIVERISSLASAPDKIESSTWKDKLADAGLQLVTNNPQIVATVTDIISRATVALASAFAPRQQQQVIVNEPIPVRAPAPLPVAPPPAAVTGLPEVPDLDEDEIEDAEIDMMEEIVKLLLSEKPLSLDDPVILDIKAEYPEIFEKAMVGIKATPSLVIVQYLCAKSQFCADLFNSQRNGPYLRERLEELKRLLNNEGGNNASTAAPQETENAPA